MQLKRAITLILLKPLSREYLFAASSVSEKEGIESMKVLQEMENC